MRSLPRAQRRRLRSARRSMRGDRHAAFHRPCCYLMPTVPEQQPQGLLCLPRSYQQASTATSKNRAGLWMAGPLLPTMQTRCLVCRVLH